MNIVMINQARDLLLENNVPAMLPNMVLTDVEQQLQMLAQCHWDANRWYINLCSRVDQVLGVTVEQKSALKRCISSAIGDIATLTLYLNYQYDFVTYRAVERSILRDLWIEKVLSNYNTTVEQQLLK